MQRDFGIVLFGATGFVGRLTAMYLAGHAPSEVRVALAGRSRERLEALRDEIGPLAAPWALLVADSSDADDMAELASRTAVVATTVGPYLKYGQLLAEQCARHGTHYADLTGEVLYVRAIADRLHGMAADSGARIVNSCGFDSVPSDLAVLMAHRHARAEGAGELQAATLVLVSASGGLSGGTVDSLRTQLAATRADAALRGVLADPYALSPDRSAEADLGPQPDAFVPYRDTFVGAWVSPFLMASYNTRIVRRSNALQDWAYGKELRYREVHGFGGPAAPVLAGGVAAGLGAMGLAMRTPLTRGVLDRVLPTPGQGPSERTRARGHFRTDTHVRTVAGARYVATVAAQGDPGYAATSVMLGESALSLALDDLPAAAGVLTPATGIGMPLVERLRDTGFRMTVTPLS